MVAILPRRDRPSSNSSRTGNTTRNYISNSSSSNNNMSTAARAQQAYIESQTARTGNTTRNYIAPYTSSSNQNNDYAAAAAFANPFLVDRGIVAPAPIQQPQQQISNNPTNNYQPIQMAAQTQPTSSMQTGFNASSPVPGSVQVIYGNQAQPITTPTQPQSWSQAMAQTGAQMNANLDPMQLMGMVGAVGVGGNVLSRLFSNVRSLVTGATRQTAVSQAARVGTYTTVPLTQLTGSAANNIAVNAATQASTASWLTRLARAASNPAVVVGSLMAAIGTYPFAGFIKEEALQTLNFASEAAIKNNDINNAIIANQQVREVLNPDMWTQIRNGIPFVNVLSELDTFYEAAALKVSVDEKRIADMQIQQATGETNAQRYERVREEESQQYQASIDYYNQQRQQMILWEQEARANEREEEAAFWAREREKQAEAERKEREATAAFWLAYKKAEQKSNDDSRPSKLNFGIL